jgi:hypothetical protein
MNKIELKYIFKDKPILKSTGIDLFACLDLKKRLFESTKQKFIQYSSKLLFSGKYALYDKKSN